MNSNALLKHLAKHYLNHGPTKRRQDAETLLAMADVLDEDSARVYLERFVDKWQVIEAQSQPITLARRRPMNKMEEHVLQKIVEATENTDVKEKQEPQIIVEWHREVS